MAENLKPNLSLVSDFKPIFSTDSASARQSVQTLELQNQLNDKDIQLKTQRDRIAQLESEMRSLKQPKLSNLGINEDEMADEIEKLSDELEDTKKSLHRKNIKLQEYEMKLEEHSKVKEMIDGINQSNLQNLESFEEQIKQRNITIEALRTDIDEKRKRAERAENDLKVAVEQKERYRVEAQQAQVQFFFDSLEFFKSKSQ